MALELNRIYNMDCLEGMKEIPDNSIDLIITSPPYNVGKDYGIYKDEIPWNEYYAWMDKNITEYYRILVKGGVVAINIPNVVKWQSAHKYRDSWNDYDPEYPAHAQNEKWFGKGRIEPIGYKLFNIMFSKDKHMREPIIWVKGSEECVVASNYQMGCDSDPFLRGCYEIILLGSKEQWFHLGGTGRRGKDAVPHADYTKDVWFIQSRKDSTHPATFPHEIPLRLIRLFCHKENAVVLDPFCGTGTTIDAAQSEEVNFIGIDLNPNFPKSNHKISEWFQ